MGKKLMRDKGRPKQTKSRSKNARVQEFYILERLYEAIRNDKKRGIIPASTKEFYLLERLYEAIRNDKNRHKHSMN